MVTISFSIKTKTVLTVKGKGVLLIAENSRPKPGPSWAKQNTWSPEQKTGPLWKLFGSTRESTLGKPWGILGSVLGRQERQPAWKLGSWALISCGGALCGTWGACQSAQEEDRQPGLWAQGGMRY